MLSRLALTDFFSEKTHVVSFGKNIFPKSNHLLRENIGMIQIQQIQKKTITLPKTNVAPENGGFQ